MLAFLAIFIAYKISLKQIFKNKDKTRANIKKTPAIWRVLNQNEFDEEYIYNTILINENLTEAKALSGTIKSALILSICFSLLAIVI